MHVVLLNQAFAPDVVATAQMSKDLADELVSRGHRVTAVASRSIYGQSGAALAKYEMLDGIEVRRVGSSVFGKTGYGARIADFGLFYARAAWRVLTLREPDIVVSFTTPPFIALIGLLARLLRGSRTVYWVMDLYPDLPVACGVMRLGAVSTRLFETLNRFLLRRSDTTVVLGRCMQERVLAKGVAADRVRLCPVWADGRALKPLDRANNPLRRSWGLEERHCCVMYSGNFGIGHDAQTICKAMERLKNHENIRFEFVGGGKRRAEVEAFIAKHSLTNATYRPYLARAQLDEGLSAGDLHLISLKEGVEGIMVPSKLYGILAAGRPAVFVGHPDSEIARVLTEAECGVVVREGDDEGLAAIIVELAADEQRRAAMGRRARKALLSHYDSRILVGALADLIEEVAAGRRHPSSRTSVVREVDE